jgi:hypothetical protein
MLYRKISTKVPATKLSAGTRSPRVQVSHVRLARAERAHLIAQIMGGEPSQAAREEAEQLAQRTQAAKSAPFLAQYRIS